MMKSKKICKTLILFNSLAMFNLWGNSTDSIGQIIDAKTAIELGASATNRVDKQSIWSILDLYRLNVTASGDSILPITSFSV